MNVVRTAGGLMLCGLLGYTVTEVATETVMYSILRRLIAERVLDNKVLAASLGPPLQLGDWRSTSFSFSNRRRAAVMCIPVQGKQRACDVTARVLRTDSWKINTLWYNILGPANWEFASLNASLPAEANEEAEHGVVIHISLLESQNHDQKAVNTNPRSATSLNRLHPEKGGAS
eukprot:jgi/Botrbrau1/12078/Bobra.0186s0006.1